MRGKKLLSLLLALILCLSLFPAALAEDSVGVIAPAADPDDENAGVISPADPGPLPGEKTGWTVPLWETPPADEINVTEHTIPVPDVKLEDLTDESVYNAMMAKKADFPEGMHWTNDDFYRWNGGVFGGGYGCAGFAFLLSDAAFGKLPAQMVDVDYETLRTGDILRVNNDSHSVIVLQVFSDHVVVAEGNYNSSIHWGRTLSRSQVEASDYVLTRWLGPVDLDSCSIIVTIEPSAFSYEEDFTMIATVKDKFGKAVSGEVVYFSILDEQGSILYTNPLGYTYYGIMTDRNGQAVFPYSFHKADGRIQPGKYLVYAELDGTTQEGSLTATAPFTLLPEDLPGDVNGDEAIDLLDLVRLRKYLVNISTPINETNADLDGDGSVGLKDLVLLRKLLVGAEQ